MVGCRVVVPDEAGSERWATSYLGFVGQNVRVDSVEGSRGASEGF